MAFQGKAVRSVSPLPVDEMKDPQKRAEVEHLGIRRSFVEWRGKTS
jgi:hypothetical protein